ncbi:MAG: DeoR/GlpR transcriptional regulator [Clostridia bacterium]|nr:DeoR/GlpR transcriptional regulator [Clostridia bacterium]NCC42305.1 DeoR/GlpR transcriptional regulator [Clostridia bacterium]
MLALERRNLILEKLQEEKRVVVSELSQLYNVSEETIRRDLEKLEVEGYAIKSYGGAVINESTSIEMPFNVRKNRNVLAKQKIAELAAQMIQDGDHIMLDASTTAVFIAKAIKDKERLTVITNSIEIMIELSDISGWNIISTGGIMKEGYLALLGSRAEDAMQSYYVDKAFVSCKAVDREMGIMDSLELFAHAKQTMMKSAKEKILVVDHTKFDSTAFSRISNVQELTTVVTDVRPAEEWVEFFENHNIECVYPQ